MSIFDLCNNNTDIFMQNKELTFHCDKLFEYFVLKEFNYILKNVLQYFKYLLQLIIRF